MLSLNARVLIVASIVLVSFFGIAGITLDRAYYLTAEEALKDRLLGQIYTLIATTGLDEHDNVFISENAPDVLYFLAGPELYAQIASTGGKIIWMSPLLASLPIQFEQTLQRNENTFSKTKLTNGQSFATMSYGVGWEDRVHQQVFVYSVAENLESFNQQINSFRRTLWGWLGGVGLVLLLAQGSIMRWGLSPLQDAAEELTGIEQGIQIRLGRNYPWELRGLTDNLNALLDHQNEHLNRYRHTLGDLAHSLKTPLAVLQSSVEEPVSCEDLKKILQEQVDRMNQISEYQLQRAATAGQIPLGVSVSVLPVTEKIITSLKKVYADKNVKSQLIVDKDLEFHGDEGDLMEIVGNLADNAYKWCESQVIINIRAMDEKDIVQEGVEINVQDDGPGIPEKLVDQVTQRGVRADQGISGHGIGLSVVQDIVQIYGGTMSITTGEFGGASISAYLLTAH